MIRLIVEVMLLMTGAAFIGWLFYIIWLGIKCFFGIAPYGAKKHDSQPSRSKQATNS